MNDACAALKSALDRMAASNPDLKAKWDAQDRAEAELIDTLRANCYDALQDIADAMRYPRISLAHLEDAIAMLTVARDCARALDR